ncbi:sigma-70 family RNA polymerase sigma factor [Roseomonas rosulenta]|uniref:sigma-70 family RNA polymerase sigma factor n=1 Tax=Roseomonas rosulenta TaxID=2748667 RepID=UPI0018DF65A7|nr:sigma-70 family RNA polymerase sigma factor [Roseomonas rosulenta]
MTGASSDFRQALAALLPQLRAFARFLARDVARADDLVQDAILRAMTEEARWEPGTDLRAWVFRILRNGFLGQLRRGGAERRALERLDRGASSAPAQQGTAELHELDRALDSLSVVQREALVLVAALGFSIEEAAAICGAPAGTVKARVSRARAALAQRFGERD